jgi:predicted transcriptional regulator
MSFELTTVTEDDDLMHVIEVMRDRGIRRIPVVDLDEALVGILTVDDMQARSKSPGWYCSIAEQLTKCLHELL